MKIKEIKLMIKDLNDDDEVKVVDGKLKVSPPKEEENTIPLFENLDNRWSK